VILVARGLRLCVLAGLTFLLWSVSASAQQEISSCLSPAVAELAAGKTAEVKAEPYAVGEIVYDIPSGAAAVVSGVGTSRTLTSSGKVGNLQVGRYDVVVSGSEYDTVRLAVDLSRGQSYELKPYRTGTLVVESTPSGAEVRVAGAYRGTTPVTVSSFYLGKYEVTQKQWVAVMGSNPSYSKGDERPVEQVSWLDVVDFCNRLSAKEGLQPCCTITGTSVSCDFGRNGYRLPTEAEWEYAAKGGRPSRGYTYVGGNDAGAVEWNDSNSGNTTHAVGGKQANELGLYDMSGNVWEWCWDWYGSYGAGAQTDPRGPSSGQYRLLRGGSAINGVTYLRAAYRCYYVPGDRYAFVGFRLARPRA
jgi:sulfatase modifying factor 1